MKRTLERVESPQQVTGDKCESKKRKKVAHAEDITECPINVTPSISQSSNAISLTKQSSSSSEGGKINGVLHSSSPSPSCIEKSREQSWDPIWGQRDPTLVSRSNLNYYNFESSLSTSNGFTSRHQAYPNNQRHAYGVEPALFLSLQEKFVPIMPTDDHCKNKNNNLVRVSKEIWTHFTQYHQNGKIFKQKMELWKELERVLKRRFRCATHVFGSTLNGFGSNESDMDLCMFNGEVKCKKGKDDVRLLAEVRRAIRYW